MPHLIPECRNKFNTIKSKMLSTVILKGLGTLVQIVILKIHMEKRGIALGAG